MKLIPLTRGLFAKVSDVSYDELSKYKWRANRDRRQTHYYAVRWTSRNPRQELVFMHRQLLGLCRGDKHEGDHINHDTLDNQLENLRVVSKSQNQQNRTPDVHLGVSGGISKIKSGKYVAYLTENHIYHWLGTFSKLEDAISARKKAEIVYYSQ